MEVKSIVSRLMVKEFQSIDGGEKISLIVQIIMLVTLTMKAEPINEKKIRYNP